MLAGDFAPCTRAGDFARCRHASDLLRAGAHDTAARVLLSKPSIIKCDTTYSARTRIGPSRLLDLTLGATHDQMTLAFFTVANKITCAFTRSCKTLRFSISAMNNRVCFMLAPGRHIAEFACAAAKRL